MGWKGNIDLMLDQSRGFLHTRTARNIFRGRSKYISCKHIIFFWFRFVWFVLFLLIQVAKSKCKLFIVMSQRTDQSPSLPGSVGQADPSAWVATHEKKKKRELINLEIGKF